MLKIGDSHGNLLEWPIIIQNSFLFTNNSFTFFLDHDSTKLQEM